MAFGVTPQGFIKKRQIDVKTEIENSLRAALGKNLNLLSASVFGQIIGIFSERESLLWEALEGAYNSQYPDTADGVSLDNVGAIVGIARIPARATVQQNLHLFGTAGTLVPQGTQVSVPNVTDAVFTTDADVVLGVGVDEVQHIAFSGVPVAGSWRLKYLDELTTLLAFNANAAAVQAALNALLNLEDIVVTGDYTVGFDVTFAGESGKIDHSMLEFLDNTLGVTILITQTTAGVPQAVVDATCVNTGPIPSFAFSLTNIVNPVPGLDSIVNTTDGVLGRNIETDTEFRKRRNESLQIAGSATVDAIRAELLQVEGVNQAIVFENTTFITDVNGLPGKSFAAYVDGGDNQDIADTIFATKPAGIETFGNITEQVTDSQGFIHNVEFSRPTPISIWIELDISTGPTFIATAAEIQQLIVDYGNALGIGTDIIVTPDLVCALDAIEGITDVEIRIGFAPAPTLDNNLTIAPQEISQWAIGRTAVNLI